MANKRKLERILINRDFQLKALAIFGSFIVLVSGIYGVAAYVSFQKFISLGTDIGLGEDHVFFKFINNQMTDLFLVFGITFVLVFITFMYAGLKFSHEVAGPLYRLNEHLKEMSKRDQSEPLRYIKFRKNDFFLELQDNFNELVNREEGSLNDSDD